MVTHYVLRFTFLIAMQQEQIQSNRSNAALSGFILALTTLLGIWAFLYPFFVQPAQTGEAGSHGGDWLLVFFLVVMLCLVAVVADMETRSLDSKTVALLGVLVATNSLLRPL